MSARAEEIRAVFDRDPSYVTLADVRWLLDEVDRLERRVSAVSTSGHGLGDPGAVNGP